MTAKRFKSINCGLQGQYIKDDGVVLTIDEVVELLNEQHEKIQQQKEAIEHLSYDCEYLNNNFEDKCKENVQLKTQLQNTSDQRDEFHRGARENANRVGKLKKENEELKSALKELKEIGDYQDCRIKDYDVALKSLQDLTDRKLKENEQLKQQVQKIHKLIDKKMEECIVFNDKKSVLVLSELKQRVIMND